MAEIISLESCVMTNEPKSRSMPAQRGGKCRSDLVVLPRVQIDDPSFGEELRDAGGEDAEVRAAVLGRLGAGVPSTSKVYFVVMFAS